MVFVFLILKGVMGLAIQKASKVKEKMKEIRDVNDMDINQSKSNENPNYVSQATSNPNPLESKEVPTNIQATSNQNLAENTIVFKFVKLKQ